MRKRKKQNDQTPKLDAVPAADILEETPAAPVRLSAYERKENQAAISARKQEEEGNIDIINDYVQASKTGATVECEISGVVVTQDQVFWQCIHGPMIVFIPFEETFDTLPNELLDTKQPEVLARRRQFLQKSIGLKIQFVITKFEPVPHNWKQVIVYGSRVKAMAKIRRAYFGPNATRPVRKGEIYEAQLLSVGEHGAWISFRGVDLPVRASHLTHRYTPSMAKTYHVGQKVRVMVTDIGEDPATGLPLVTVSGRAIELEESQHRRSLAPIGSVFAATITTKHKRFTGAMPSVTISLWLENVDLPAYSTTQAYNDERFVTGDKVYVEILGYTDAGYAHCKILRRAGNSI